MSGGPAYLPPVAPLPLRRGLSRQVHQPKCHSAYLCVCVCLPRQNSVSGGQVLPSLSLSSFLSPSLFLFFPSFSFSLPFWLSLPPSSFSLSIPLPVCFRLSLSFSPYCLCLSVYPLRHHLTQQCRVVVSCHPAVRQRSSRTEGKDRPGREYTLRLPRPIVRRSIVGWRKWTRGHREGEGSNIPDGTHVLLTPIVESLRWTSDLLKYSNARNLVNLFWPNQ